MRLSHLSEERVMGLFSWQMKDYRPREYSSTVVKWDVHCTVPFVVRRKYVTISRVDVQLRRDMTAMCDQRHLTVASFGAQLE